MKDIALLLLLSFAYSNLQSQVSFYTEPHFPTTDDDITIYFDAANSDKLAVETCADVYVYTGVITDQCKSSEGWKYIVTNQEDGQLNHLMTALGNGLYSLSFNVRDFYDFPRAENVVQLGFKFLDVNGQVISKGKYGPSFFVPIYKADILLTTRLHIPTKDLKPTLGETIDISAVVSQEAELALYDNGELLATNYGTNLVHAIDAALGNHIVALVATDSCTRDISYFSYEVKNETATDLSNPEINLTSSAHENIMLDQPERELSFNITPNPSDGDLSIYYQTNTNLPIELNIIEVTGKPLYKAFISSFPGIHTKSLEMDLESGIYLVQLKMKNKIITKKFIIQK